MERLARGRPPGRLDEDLGERAGGALARLDDGRAVGGARQSIGTGTVREQCILARGRSPSRKPRHTRPDRAGRMDPLRQGEWTTSNAFSGSCTLDVLEGRVSVPGRAGARP
jgi:hypothetical protein